MSVGTASRWATFLLLSAFAVAAVHADESGTFALVVENDEFFESDHGYTNGVQAIWVSPSYDVPALLSRAAPALVPLFPRVCENPNCKVRANYALGQNMYTPHDLSLTNPPTSDRPYAGWLYGAVGLVAASKHNDGAQLDEIQLQVGMVGPASLAEETQTRFHEIIGARTPMGWDTQLKNEPGVVLTYKRSWRHRLQEMPTGLTLDLVDHLGGAFGNVSIYANGGATLMLGWNIGEDCYGPQRIEPSSLGTSNFAPPPEDNAEFYFFASIDGRAVGRNIFLDGNTWRDSRHVEKNNFLLGSQLGFAFALNPVRIAFSHVYRSREFESQASPDEYGSLDFAIAF